MIAPVGAGLPATTSAAAPAAAASPPHFSCCDDSEVRQDSRVLPTDVSCSTRASETENILAALGERHRRGEPREKCVVRSYSTATHEFEPCTCVAHNTEQLQTRLCTHAFRASHNARSNCTRWGARLLVSLGTNLIQLFRGIAELQTDLLLRPEQSRQSQGTRGRERLSHVALNGKAVPEFFKVRRYRPATNQGPAASVAGPLTFPTTARGYVHAAW